MTKVSIITPMYNTSEEDYNKTMASIHNQTVTDYEWIVVDDGTEYEFDGDGMFSQVHILNNYGPSVARNVGFQISRGDIITYVDMGDELDEDRVRILINFWKDWDVDLLFSAYELHNDPNFGTHTVDHIKGMQKIGHMDASEYISILNKVNISIPLGVAHSRKPFVLAGGFQPGIVCGEDGILWRRMVDLIEDKSRVMFTDIIAGHYYISQTGQSRTQRRFEMGGFATDGSKKDNGRYLDGDWYKNYHSKNWYDKEEENE